MNTQINSLSAWGHSLPRVIAWPVALWVFPIAFAAVFGSNWLLGVGWLCLCATGIHLASYTLLGLPIYLFFWDSFAKLWTWPLGVPLGLILGALAMNFVVFLIAGTFPSGDFGLLSVFVGAMYGVSTAGAAISQRMRIEQ